MVIDKRHEVAFIKQNDHNSTYLDVVLSTRVRLWCVRNDVVVGLLLIPNNTE